MIHPGVTDTFQRSVDGSLPAGDLLARLSGAPFLFFAGALVDPLLGHGTITRTKRSTGQ